MTAKPKPLHLVESQGASDTACWYVVSNEVGTILAVFGKSLSHLAERRGAEIARSTGARIALHEIVGPRPAVGRSISMAGEVRWL